MLAVVPPRCIVLLEDPKLGQHVGCMIGVGVCRFADWGSISVHHGPISISCGNLVHSCSDRWLCFHTALRDPTMSGSWQNAVYIYIYICARVAVLQHPVSVEG